MSHQDFGFGPADEREGAQLPAEGLEAAPGRESGRRAGEKQRVVGFFCLLFQSAGEPIPSRALHVLPSLSSTRKLPLLCL